MSHGAPDNLQWHLTDHHGRRVSEKDFLGRYQIVYFGFTHCKKVCPRALGRISAVLEDVGDLVKLIQPLYISVDPARDTPEVMREFLESNFPRFLGLTGTQQEAEVARSAFRVFAGRRADPNDPEGYEVPHSALTYLIDPEGKYLTHFADTVEAPRIVERLKQLVR